MRDELLDYYERELASLRKLGSQFASRYPGVASRLMLEPTRCEDPHVERLLESFAFLAARVHLKLDDEFPELTESLLSVVYPHFVRPVPSMTVVQFGVDVEKAKLTTGYQIDRGTVLYSKPVGGMPCKFRTCYDITVWPVAVTLAEWTTTNRLSMGAAEGPYAIRLQINAAKDVPLPGMGLDRLRFYLHGESPLVHALYEMLCGTVQRVIIRDPVPRSRTKPVVLAGTALRAAGFDERESLLPYPRRSFSGYRLLQEFFALPEKFFFFDLVDLDAVWRQGFTSAAEIIFPISKTAGEDVRQRLELGIRPDVFRLGCTPAVNLFTQTCEPILLTQRNYEYPVVPDARRTLATEIFSVDEVVSIDATTRETVQYEPFYSHRHGAGTEKREPCFWISNRRDSTRPNDDGTDVYVSLVDLRMRPMQPEADSLTIRATCTNRSLPSKLLFGNEHGDFEMEGNAPVSRIVSLRKPTAPLRPPTSRLGLWRLISHLSLNYLSLVEEGREALQHLLRLYEFTSSAFPRNMIDGIIAIRSRPQFSRVISDNGIAFARGTRVDMELDEEQFVGGGAYLFGSVLEHFLSLYASLNSFTQLNLTSRQRKEPIAEWPPRAGNRILV